MKKVLLGFVVAFSTLMLSDAQAGVGLKFSPISAAFGLIDVDLDIGITENIVLTPSGQYWSLKISDIETKITGFGVSGSYHFSGAFQDSWYLGPAFRSYTVSAEDEFNKAEGSVTVIGGIFGYQWAWTSFYMNLGGFVGSLSDAEIKEKNKATGLETGDKTTIPSTLGVGLDFKLGWYF